MARIVDYIAERHPQYPAELAADIYLQYLHKESFRLLDNEFGFVTYKFQGDACIVNDVYVNKQYRKSKKTWVLWQELLATIQANPDCKVIIGFSEHVGANRADGIGAMEAAGFIRTYELTDKLVYMRGTY